MLERFKHGSVHLLRWSEKYTKTDMIYLAQGSAWSAIDTILSALISLATALAFANLIPKETYGTYQYVLVVADLFGILVLGGVDTASARSVARGMEGSIFDGLRAKIRWGLLGGAGSVMLGAYYLAHTNRTLGWAFIIIGIFIPFWEAPTLYAGYLQGKKRFDLATACDVIGQLIPALVLIPCLFLTHNLFIILAAYLLSWGGVRALLFWLTIHLLPPNRARDPDMVTYGKHLTVMTAVSTVASSADDVLLWHFLGPAAVAIYIFAQAIPTRAAGVIKTITRLAFPKFAATDSITLKQTLPRKVILLFGISLLGALAYILCAQFIFTLFFPQYLASVHYSQLLALIIAMQPFNLFSSALSAQAKKKALYIYNFAVPAVRLILLFSLIPPFGIWGAVFALVITDVFDSAISATLFYWA